MVRRPSSPPGFPRHSLMSSCRSAFTAAALRRRAASAGCGGEGGAARAHQAVAGKPGQRRGAAHYRGRPRLSGVAHLARAKKGELMIRIALPALVALGAALPCFAQYPDRPLTVVAGFPAGGLVDVVSRVVAEGMKPRYPKGVIVVNKPGAGGAVAVSEVVQAKPDGYTIVLTPLSSLVIGPQLNRDLSYKTPDDYDPVINVVAYYPLLVVRSDAPWKTIQEFVADGKANAGKLRVGTPGEGTSSHLNLEEFMFRTGVKLTHVPYAGWGQSSPALPGGHIEAVVGQPREAKGLGGRKRTP